MGVRDRVEETLTVGERVEWPDGKDFAFTIFDDTDNATVANVGPIYDFLEGVGLRTTKSVWPVRGDGNPKILGSTVDEPAYRAWTLDLQARGFEIGYHGATYVTAPRELVIRSLDAFKNAYGQYPTSMANHSGCDESIYWGADRVSGVNRLAYNLLTRFSKASIFRGHKEGDRLFWGDLCRRRIRYVRNFTFLDVNTLRACPIMPYFDPDRPYVNAWFAGSEGSNVDAFSRMLSERNQDRLQQERGACIMYTHLASGFLVNGELHPTFERLVRRLSAKNGWFVPVGTLLSHLEARNGRQTITKRDRARLERRWLLSKVRAGPT
jgi:hypothetical protein